MAEVVVKSGHVRPVWAGHPWVYAQGIQTTRNDPQPGDEVRVLDARGRVLGRGLYSPNSAIAVRLYTRDADEPFDGALVRARIARAWQQRRELGLVDANTSGLRVVNAEGDGIPGLLLDRFGDTVVLQCGSIGIRRRLDTIVEAISQQLEPRSILDRTSPSIAKLEGFEASPALLAGPEVSELRFSERGLRFEIPIAMAQKTGFYFDLRALRARFEELARGRRVLDCYGYVGAAGLFAARGGASEVLSVDKSAAAIDVALRCAQLNGLSDRYRAEKASAFDALARAAENPFDLVMCDPPKLAPRRSNKKQALSLLEQLSAKACQATADGGLLVLCSCSATVAGSDLMRVLALGAASAGRTAITLGHFVQDQDHPVPAAFPEGLYLSAVLARVTSR